MSIMNRTVVIQIFLAVASIGLLVWTFVYPVLLYQFLQGDEVSEELFAGILLYGSGAVAWLGASYFTAWAIVDGIKNEYELSKRFPTGDAGYFALVFAGLPLIGILILCVWWLVGAVTDLL